MFSHCSTSLVCLSGWGNLNVIATQTVICPGQTTTLTASGASGTYTWNPGSISGSVIAVSPTVTTTYTVASTSSLGCTRQATIQISVPVSPGFTFSANANPQVICSNLSQSSTLTAQSNGSGSFTWLPGGLSGTSIVVTPSINTVYTVSTAESGCSFTRTLSITVTSACCTPTQTAFTSTAFPTTTLGGLTYTAPLAFNTDVTIPTGVAVTLANAEFVFAPNVKLTVSPGATLSLRGAHLYSCSDMWQGIVVQNEGWMETSQGSPNTNLIEDAIVGVDMSNHNTGYSIATPIVDLFRTVFNKNLAAIKISSLVCSATDHYPVRIRECVFTSRSLTYTPSSWPSTSTSALRAVVNPTTGLTPPYTLQGSLTNLKNPYSTLTASVGVLVENTGLTSGSNYYGVKIGSETGESDFNLFDNLIYGVDAVGSNLCSVNNVFQNTVRSSTFICAPKCGTHYFGGSAIRSSITGNLNARLSLNATGTYSANYSLGNPFWDCHTGVDLSKIYRFDCNYATFRSTQTNTLTQFDFERGNTGIKAQTNRADYFINYNRFNNINVGINVPLSSGTYTMGVNTYTGILSNNLMIAQNYFGAQLTNTTTVTNQFMSTAVAITGPGGAANWSNTSNGLSVASNTVNRSYRGVYVNGSQFSNPAHVKDNGITLLNDAQFSVAQYGVHVSSSLSHIVQTNTISAVNTTNTLVTLVYSGSNSNHQVLCNDLSTAFQGFVFNAPHTGTNIWKGNKMQTLANGFCLTNNGQIGQQGSTGNPIDNQWNSTWTGANHTSVDATSNGTNSKFYTRVGGVWQPTLNIGPIGANYNTGGYVNTTNGSYSCGGGGGGGARMMASSDSSLGTSNLAFARISNVGEMNELEYIEATANYRFLVQNDSVRNSDSVYVEYCHSLEGSSVDKFYEAEKTLLSGDTENAISLLSGVNPVNSVEANYISYFSLYKNYIDNAFGETDSTILAELAAKCPGTEGECIYGARALYNLAYGDPFKYLDDCGQNSLARFTSGYSENVKRDKWEIGLFPNPTQGKITLRSSEGEQLLTIVIRDVAGKIIHRQISKIKDHFANLDLSVPNGLYLISITNEKNEARVKKLVVNH